MPIRRRSRRTLTFEVVVELEADGSSWSAWSPALPGCFSNGGTRSEARRNMREAIELHLASLVAHGEPIPRARKRVHVEELTVGIPA